jgi:hypothetical protein
LAERVGASGGPASPTAASRTPPVSHNTVDLVVLTDYLIADPRMVRDLHSQGIPHLPVRVRDGTGLVGPLIIPRVNQPPR